MCCDALSKRYAGTVLVDGGGISNEQANAHRKCMLVVGCVGKTKYLKDDLASRAGKKARKSARKPSAGQERSGDKAWSSCGGKWRSGLAFPPAERNKDSSWLLPREKGQVLPRVSSSRCESRRLSVVVMLAATRVDT